MVSNKASNKEKIAVIGGGIIGLCIAVKLQLQGHDVTVFDKKGPGEGCSKGNAGHFATEQIFPLATPTLLPQLPKMLLSKNSPVSIRYQDVHKTMPWMLRFLMNARKSATEHATQALTELNGKAMESWFTLLEEVGLTKLITMRGSLLTFENTSLFDSYRSTLRELRNRGVSCQVWEKETIQTKLPNLSENVQVGVFFPETGHTVNPYEICNLLAGELKNKWVHEPVVEVSTDGEKSIVATEKDCYSFDKTVIATGAESAHLVERITGIRVPLQAERGYHLMLPELTNTLPFAVSSADRKFIMTPMESGLRLAGTVEYAGLTSPPNMKRATMLKELAAGLLKQDISLVKSGEKWMGNRPSLPDSLPVIDQTKDRKILFAFGHQHLGLTQAAVTADLICQLQSETSLSVDISPFALDRF
ncbi:FAD-binding oxidoreductase [Vibrio sp. RE86]|uniref:NAD(P)/FAD-dependent oxidoreductase n=1 Tax=Vibrio sp. RE86 TaxID=2607605 RepID=UPI0014933C33|nr:FAD-dependent oxidoreductase [Vibrio sp. RE86]NOH78393.1 FAD-binding oxidoreductase [Vibrio sp. RE86]